jgi:excinuclease ABC subunit C
VTFELKKLKLERIPNSPGVYFFIGKKNKILYIGKAANLRERIRSYFLESASPKITRLRSEAKTLKILPLRSEIEALIKEASFIKHHRPKYNILMRDDKNYFFVVFTKETFPKILITHQPRRWKVGAPTETSEPKKIKNYEVLGPYVSGKALRTTLRLIRRIFPYCTCLKPHHRICLQSQLGLCPGICCRKNVTPTKEEKLSYQAAIRHIKKILKGESDSLERELKKALEEASRQKRFEEAARIRDELQGLSRILEHRGVIIPVETKETPEARSTLEALQKILGMEAFPYRIECYDASVLAGTHAVGAMTSFKNGVPDTSAWRLFRMRKKAKPNDPAQISEMIARRLKHREWELPQLIIVDGGQAQYNAAWRAVRQEKLKITIAAIAKGKPQHDRLLWGKPSRRIDFKNLPPPVRNFLLRLRDATHRFALSYHRRRRRLVDSQEN